MRWPRVVLMVACVACLPVVMGGCGGGDCRAEVGEVIDASVRVRAPYLASFKRALAEPDRGARFAALNELLGQMRTQELEQLGAPALATSDGLTVREALRDWAEDDLAFVAENTTRHPDARAWNAWIVANPERARSLEAYLFARAPARANLRNEIDERVRASGASSCAQDVIEQRFPAAPAAR